VFKLLEAYSRSNPKKGLPFFFRSNFILKVGDEVAQEWGLLKYLKPHAWQASIVPSDFAKAATRAISSQRNWVWS
jgi:hypothetical protein